MEQAIPSLAAIGFSPFFEAQRGQLDGGLMPARIAIAHGESYISWTQDGVRKAVLSGRRIGDWTTAIERPQVGDWVTGTYEESAGVLVIEHMLDRRTCLLRRAAGESGDAQVIASNVDVVGIVSAFGAGAGAARDRRLINESRLNRYLAAVEQSGAAPLLIVNKSDLSEAPQRVGKKLSRAFPGVPVVWLSGQQGSGFEGLGDWLRPGQTLALVGMSGVGKSTLVNALLGRQAQETGEVRDADGRGRHTTTHRELFMMVSGALLIDTPGMRELAPWKAEEAASFDDVEALAATCRFSDCRHASEPGCAILQALETGALSPERWTRYEQHQARRVEQVAGARPEGEEHARHRRGRRRG